MKLSIVTPNYNGKNFLEKYFNSLNQDSDHIGEVIIIDNGSDDGSLEFIEKNSFNFPIVIIKNKENLGFAKAVNQGILKAKHELIFSLNNDAFLKKGSIKSMMDLMNNDNNIFSVQAKMLQFNNPNLIDDAGDEYNLLAWSRKIGENQNTNKYSETFKIFSSCAGAAIYRKSLLLELGMFDENYFAYVEDIDLAIRGHINGYYNLCCPEAIVYHIGSATSGSRHNEFKVKISARNNVWTVYKNIPIPFKIINFIFLFFGFLIKYLFFARKGFGSSYLAGIKEGLFNKSEVKKIGFKKSNLKNYFKLEYELILNTLRFLKR